MTISELVERLRDTHDWLKSTLCKLVTTFWLPSPAWRPTPPSARGWWNWRGALRAIAAEKTTDHLGDEWISPAASVARAALREADRG